MTTLDARCVYCRDKPVDPAWRPFCSERCRMADLGRWLTGGYSVPGDSLPTAPNADDDDVREVAIERGGGRGRSSPGEFDGRDTDDHR